MQKLILLFSLFLSSIAAAQVGTKTDTATQKKTPPRDGFYDNTITKDRHNLKPTTPHERDVSFSKIVWREIPLAHLQNKYFTTYNSFFVTVLFEGIKEKQIIAYSTTDDEFKTPMPEADFQNILEMRDTIKTFCDESAYELLMTHGLEPFIIRNAFNPETIVSYRIKEGWYFDEKTAKMEARILGIAPIQKKVNDNDELIGYMPIFWIYYPQARDFLARQAVANQPNTSWADVFDKRMFGSHITKENNIGNKRLKDSYNEKDALLEAEKLKQQMQNREADRFED
jgi:gliding motility associated protien GldN